MLALVVARSLLTLAVPVRAWFAQRARDRRPADRRRVAARDRVAALEVEKQRWDDPSFVAAEARRRLHFVLPGEVGYVTLGSEAAAAAPTRPSEGPALAVVLRRSGAPCRRPTTMPPRPARLSGLDAADAAAVARQLGREPRGAVRVAHRCPCGEPDVVMTAPRLPDGTPFPTAVLPDLPAGGGAPSARWRAAG